MGPFDIDPTIFAFGPFQIRWYGLMYVIGFFLGSQLLVKLCRERFLRLPVQSVDILVFYLILSVFIGARLTYVFVYNWDYYSQNLLEIFSVWRGGLSFHGGLCGFVVVALLVARKHRLSFFELGDALALAAPQGFFFGRLGNFINGELYGRITSSPIGIIFRDGGPMPRHPSQLYEAFGEGILLTATLWFLKGRVQSQGIIMSAFLIGYGLIRFIIEFFREPDAQLGYFAGGLVTMGQILCLLTILAGFGLLGWAIHRRQPMATVSIKGRK